MVPFLRSEIVSASASARLSGAKQAWSVDIPFEGRGHSKKIHLMRFVLRSIFVAALLVLCADAPVTAQSQHASNTSVLDDVVVQHQTRKGLDYLYDMRFERARRMFELVDEGHPQHPIGPFLLALNTWWEILIDLSDESRDDEFYAAMDEVIRRSDRLLARNKDNFDAWFFKGAALGFRGRLRSNRGDWFRAAKDGIRAMDYVLGVVRREPDNADYAFGKGIYDYYAAAVPDRYPYVKPVMIFFPNGNRARGITELERTVRDGRFIQTEAAYFLLQIYYLFENDYAKSVYYADWLRDRHPDNSFFHTLEGRVYAKWGQWPSVREIFADVLSRYKNRQTGYNAALAEQALYFLARSHMAESSYDSALQFLDQLQSLAARDSEESYFEILGRLRQGMSQDALGRRNEAIAAYQDVLTMEDASGSHDRAQRYLERPFGS